MPVPSITITVSENSWRCLDEDPQPPNRIAEYGFSAKLQNSGNQSVYEARVLLKCNYPIQVKEHDANFVPDRTDANAASFRLSCPIHPKEPTRHISWSATAPAYLQWAASVNKDPKITIEFEIYAKDSAPNKLVAVFDANDDPPQTKEAVPTS